jgi:hypothetical protein
VLINNICARVTSSVHINKYWKISNHKTIVSHRIIKGRWLELRVLSIQKENCQPHQRALSFGMNMYNIPLELAN